MHHCRLKPVVPALPLLTLSECPFSSVYTRSATAEAGGLFGFQFLKAAMPHFQECTELLKLGVGAALCRSSLIHPKRKGFWWAFSPHLGPQTPNACVVLVTEKECISQSKPVRACMPRFIVLPRYNAIFSATTPLTAHTVPKVAFCCRDA